MNTQTHFPRTRAGIEAGVVSMLPEVRPAAPKPLSKSEVQDLARCEALIHSGLDEIGKQWRQIARHWCHIRDEKLYRMEFRRIEDYTRARFGKSAARLRQLILGEGVMRDLEEVTDGGVQVLPTHESQVRALAPLPKAGRIIAWDEAKKIAGNGKQPTARDVAEAAERQKWPKPNEHGVFDEGLAEKLRFAHAKASAEIALLQIGATKWISSLHYQYKGTSVGCGSNCGPLTARETFASRIEALRMAAAQLTDDCFDKIKYSPAQASLARKLMGWAGTIVHAAEERAPRPATAPGLEPAAKSDGQGQWVICRRALYGATSPSAMVARYSGPGWGWSPNPEKGKPFTNKQEALTEAFRHNDDVVSLEEARRPAPTTIQVRGHERTVGKPPDGQELLDAKFRVIDAEVELRSALLLLKRAGGELTQELYHAEKALDHLGCLKGLLDNGGAKKGKR